MRPAVSLLLAVICAAVSCSSKPQHYDVRVVREYPHNDSCYTQGLFFHDGTLYESSGQYGESAMRTVDLETGKTLGKVSFGRKYFAEGSVIMGDSLYILTWTNKVAFVYNPVTLQYKGAFTYPREGWGLTTDGESLIASDGSSRLYFYDKDFRQQRVINVRYDGRPVKLLNELEWVDGRIWANVYTSDLVVIINPDDGNVEGLVNCAGLLPDSLRDSRTDVLNGIAVNDGRIYLTGKYWKRLYEVELVPARNGK